MRFGPAFILDPDRLGPQKLDRRDIALIVATMVVVPTQAEDTGGVVARRQMPVAHVNVGERVTPGSPGIPQTMQASVAPIRRSCEPRLAGTRLYIGHPFGSRKSRLMPTR